MQKVIRAIKRSETAKDSPARALTRSLAHSLTDRLARLAGEEDRGEQTPSFLPHCTAFISFPNQPLGGGIQRPRSNKVSSRDATLRFLGVGKGMVT